MRNDFHHSVSLISVFLIGNMIISFPKGEGQAQSLWGFIICIALAFVLCIFYARLQSFESFNIKILKISDKSTALKYITATMFTLLCFLSYVICCKDYIKLVSTQRLPKTPSTVIAAVFTVLTLLIAFSKSKVCNMFALVSLTVIFICSLIMLIISLSGARFSLLYGNLPFDIKNSLKQALTFFIHSFGEIIIILLLIGNKKYTYAKKSQIFGIGISGVILFICLSQVLLLLGPYAAEIVEFPYATATGSITSGKTYSRMDGFTYYIYFICSLLKASFILKSTINTVFYLKKNLKVITAVFFAVFGFIFSVFQPFHSVLQSKAINFLLLCTEIITPMFIFLLAKASKKSSGNKL